MVSENLQMEFDMTVIHEVSVAFAKRLNELKADNARLREVLADVCKAAREVWESPDKIPYAGEDERFWALVYDLRLAVERAENALESRNTLQSEKEEQGA